LDLEGSLDGYAKAKKEFNGEYAKVDQYLKNHNVTEAYELAKLMKENEQYKEKSWEGMPAIVDEGFDSKWNIICHLKHYKNLLDDVSDKGVFEECVYDFDKKSPITQTAKMKAWFKVLNWCSGSCGKYEVIQRKLS
jgi:hypothetical protein